MITIVVGARPNFVKVAPLIRELDKNFKHIKYSLVHTKQHYDEQMDAIFFEDLEIPRPDISFDTEGKTHAEITASIMVNFERYCVQNKPDLVLVVGDVNSTLACAIAAKKLNINVAHIESGLRSFDIKMPEEINRKIVDSISDILFITEESARKNLISEGHDRNKIKFVGNLMIDNLFFQLRKIEKLQEETPEDFRFLKECERYGLLTLHRPSNVDEDKILTNILNAVKKISNDLHIIFSIHPRTEKSIRRLKLDLGPNISCFPALPFNKFLILLKDADIVLTDSGGLQEESCVLGVNCLTLRENTERPVTVESGFNRICGNKFDGIIKAYESLKHQRDIKKNKIKKWDGNTSKRICKFIDSYLG